MDPSTSIAMYPNNLSFPSTISSLQSLHLYPQPPEYRMLMNVWFYAVIAFFISCMSGGGESRKGIYVHNIYDKVVKSIKSKRLGLGWPGGIGNDACRS